MQTNLTACFSSVSLALAVLSMIAGLTVQGAAQSLDSRSGEPMESRLRRLEDREEIRRLLVDYGRTLDQRDFGAFAGLFAEDAEYTGGGGTDAIKGAAAIGKSLEEIFRKNPTGLRSPSFHLFTNEVIEIHGDEATALSKGLFVVPGDDNKPGMVMLATYSDTLTRKRPLEVQAACGSRGYPRPAGAERKTGGEAAVRLKDIIRAMCGRAFSF